MREEQPEDARDDGRRTDRDSGLGSLRFSGASSSWCLYYPNEMPSLGKVDLEGTDKPHKHAEYYFADIILQVSDIYDSDQAN